MLSNTLKYTLDLAHNEDAWIQPLRDVIEDVDAETARWKPAPDVASIWEIAAHTAPYLESRVCDYTGDPYPEEPDWPEISDPSDEAWAALKGRIVSGIDKLKQGIDGLNDDQLQGDVPGRRGSRVERLMDIAIHDAYHAGQIVKLTQLYRATH